MIKLISYTNNESILFSPLWELSGELSINNHKIIFKVCYDNYSKKDYSDYFIKEVFEIDYDEYDFESLSKKIELKVVNQIKLFLYNFINEHIKAEQDFLDYHCTGQIVERYENNLNEYTKNIEDLPILLGSFTSKKGLLIEFRQSGIKNEFYKLQNQNFILDSSGNKIKLSDAEILNSGYSIYDTSVYAFYKNEHIGSAFDSSGLDAYFIKEDYQSQGIGTELMTYFRNQFPSSRKIGPMTDLGIKLAKSFFRKNQ